MFKRVHYSSILSRVIDEWYIPVCVEKSFYYLKNYLEKEGYGSLDYFEDIMKEQQKTSEDHSFGMYIVVPVDTSNKELRRGYPCSGGGIAAAMFKASGKLYKDCYEFVSDRIEASVKAKELLENKNNDGRLLLSKSYKNQSYFSKDSILNTMSILEKYLPITLDLSATDLMTLRYILVEEGVDGEFNFDNKGRDKEFEVFWEKVKKDIKFGKYEFIYFDTCINEIKVNNCVFTFDEIKKYYIHGWDKIETLCDYIQDHQNGIDRTREIQELIHEYENYYIIKDLLYWYVSAGFTLEQYKKKVENSLIEQIGEERTKELSKIYEEDYKKFYEQNLSVKGMATLIIRGY